MEPLLCRPRIVGYMSLDATRNYKEDLSELKFIVKIPEGRVSLDLNHNIDNALKRTTGVNKEKLEQLMKFVKNQSHRIDPKIHFRTYRSTLIAVMKGAFGLEPIIVVASLYKGTIYLCNILTPDRVQREENMNEEQKRFCAWGYKFEQYMGADLPNIQPNTQNPVQENAEFYYICEASLASHTLLYGAQIDGMLAIDGSAPEPPKNADYETNIKYLNQNSFVELKTNRVIQYKKQDDNFKRQKMFHCWGQCYLAGLKGLIVGYRNDRGVVERLQWFNTEDIVRYCKGVWDPNTALKFLDYFLTHVKNEFKNYVKQKLGNEVNFKEIGPISLQFDIDVNSTISVTDNVCETILPDWFVNST